MQIDISKLYNHTLSSINIEQEVIIPEEYLKNTDIKELKNVVFKGNIENLEETINVEGIVEGIMVLEDNISLEDIDYKFSSEIDEKIEENIENSSNILDITDILWQNILLEVPLKLTNVTNFDEYHGDGWKLISEDSIESTNNPFKELEEMFKS